MTETRRENVTMGERDWLAERFEASRAHLRAVAYRMLGSLSEADDAVQESWLRLSRSDPASIENLGGWLTTVVARVSLDMLRSHASRREEPLGTYLPDPDVSRIDGAGPEDEAVLADSVGLALLVVLETLAPAERLAFVLHDMFAVPFDEIAPIVGRSRRRPGSWPAAPAAGQQAGRAGRPGSAARRAGSLSAGRPGSPVLGGQREALVIPPGSGHLQVPRRESLMPEAEPGHQRDGRLVGRLDVSFQPVQAHRAKGDADHLGEAIAHQAAPGLPGERRVAQVGRRECPQHNLVEVDETDEAAVGLIDDEKSGMLGPADPFQVPGVADM
jgi:RNA polymerase sigma factor (sigma-70 family)